MSKSSQEHSPHPSQSAKQNDTKANASTGGSDSGAESDEDETIPGTPQKQVWSSPSFPPSPLNICTNSPTPTLTPSPLSTHAFADSQPPQPPLPPPPPPPAPPSPPSIPRALARTPTNAERVALRHPALASLGKAWTTVRNSVEQLDENVDPNTILQQTLTELFKEVKDCDVNKLQNRLTKKVE